MRSDDIAQERFRTTVFEPGYEPREVDGFLERAAASLRFYEQGSEAPGDVLDVDAVRGARFTSTRFRSGYHPRDVDDLLDRLVEVLRAHERAHGASESNQ